MEIPKAVLMACLVRWGISEPVRTLDDIRDLKV